MPITASLAYPTVEEVMDLARSYVNDTLPGLTGQPGEGQILTDSPTVSPFTLPFIKAATRELYREMGNAGVPTFIKDNYILEGLPIVNGPQGAGVADPTIQVQLSYAGFYDGTNIDPNLVLPSDLLTIERIWERQTGSNLPFQDTSQAEFGLIPGYQGMYMGQWEYRSDAIWFPGAVVPIDIRLRYHAALPLVGINSDFSSTTIPLLDSADALALKVAAKYTFARGGAAEAQGLEQKAENEVRQMKNRQVRRQQSTEYHREPYGSDDGSQNSGYGQ